MDDTLFKLGVWVPVLLLSATFHEVAHGYAAFLLGDSTAKNQGRLTLNPIAHIDPMGVGVMIITALFFPFAIGWAKPVPVNPMYFREPHKGMMITALAGPATNMIIAFIFNLVVRLMIFLQVIPPGKIAEMLATIVFLNLILAAFNLIPIPPLDGSRVVAYFIPRQYKHYYFRLEQFGMFIVIFFVISGVFRYILLPIMIGLAFIALIDIEVIYQILFGNYYPAIAETGKYAPLQYIIP
jgi:Zn-dependent protease